MAEQRRDVTVLLERWRNGDRDAASQLLREVYDDLHGLAGGYMRRERSNHTLQATALLNEAWVRLTESQRPPVDDRQQFFRAMAAYMRRHLVDHARRRRADKRGSGAQPIPLSEVEDFVSDRNADRNVEEDLQRLDRALESLHLAHPRAAKVVELRVFGGKSVEETAAALAIGTGTVKRDFFFAKGFLLEELKGDV